MFDIDHSDCIDNNPHSISEIKHSDEGRAVTYLAVDLVLLFFNMRGKLTFGDSTTCGELDRF